MLRFDPANVKFTGVSGPFQCSLTMTPANSCSLGGSLLLSGFFLPAFAAQYTPTSVLLNCGALAPQVAFVSAAAVAPALRIHYQSSQNELSILQQSIPAAIAAYEALATSADVAAAALGALQTANNAPVGGHWCVM